MSDTGIRERTVSANGVDLHVVEAGSSGPVVVLSHGFPELSYSWRHQLPVLAAAGYRVVAPDQRGYGRSSRPDAVEDYDVHHLAADLVAILDDIGEDRAVFVGHDWGSVVVSHVALQHSDRVAGLVNMSVAHLPRGEAAPTTVFRNVFGDSFFYILYFQEPGVADAELGRDPARTMRRMLAGLTTGPGGASGAAMFTNNGQGFVDRLPEPASLPDWLTQQELDHYIDEFARTGFTGGINWYRNFDRNWATTEHLAGVKVECPSLFIGGRLDPVLLMTPPEIGHGVLSDHRGDVIVDGAGHWVQQEAPDAVNTALNDFLQQLPR